jgi:drug/metabolite transporter (DMT)-like permease
VYGIVTFPLLAIWYWQGWTAKQRAANGAGPVKRSPPTYTLILIGCMNGLGNFCAGVGQVHTGGTSQALLQLVGVPFVLVLSWIFLQQRPSLIASISALAIVGGTALSAVPHAEKDTGSLWYSNLLFFSAQIFFSAEKVYEEATFGEYSVDVLWMFLWTLWTQVVLGWAAWPVQSVPAFGGINTTEIPSLVVDGIQCTAGLPGPPNRPFCDWQNPLLFWTYCAVDYSYYAIGAFFSHSAPAPIIPSPCSWGLHSPTARLPRVCTTHPPTTT